MWILFSFLAPLFRAISNIIDSYLINNIFKNKFSLILISSTTNLIFLPIILFFQFPEKIDLNLIPFFIVIGILDYWYLIPYYKALQLNESSKVISFYSLWLLFTPILAYFAVDEKLSFYQYIWYFIIIISSIVLSLDLKWKKIVLNKSIIYMVIAWIMLSISNVIWKYIFNNVDFFTWYFWWSIISFLIFLNIFFIKDVRSEIKKNIFSINKNFKLLIFNEFLTFVGIILCYYAISISDVSIVKWIVWIQPIYVLTFTIILSKYFPNIFKENLWKIDIIKKLIFYIFIFLWVFLLLFKS